MNRGLVIIVAAAALAGCSGEDHGELRAWMQQSTRGLAGKVDPLPEIKPFEVASYEVGNLVDPFQTSRLDVEKKRSGGGGLQPDFNRRKEPLEAYPLESLAMVGSLEQRGAHQALIKAEANLHRVKTGNYLGQNFGVITNINETSVVLKELVQDSAGEWTERTSTLQLLGQEAKR